LNTAHLHYFKRILRYLGSIPPGEINTNKLAQNLQVDHKTAFHYLSILADVGLVRFLYPYDGGAVMLRKPQKIYVHNTTLLHALSAYTGESADKGTERELFFLQSMQDAGHELYFSRRVDFRTAKARFEIGGKNKTKKQIRNSDLK